MERNESITVKKNSAVSKRKIHIFMFDRGAVGGRRTAGNGCNHLPPVPPTETQVVKESLIPNLT